MLFLPSSPLLSFHSHTSAYFLPIGPFEHNIHLSSIAYGVIAGVISYMLLNGIPLALKKISGGRIVPPDIETAEKWVIPPGGITPPWMYVSSFLDFKDV